MIVIRPVEEADLETLYEHQSDPMGAQMAQFPSRDREAHFAHWHRILANPTTFARAVTVDGRLAGNFGSWLDDEGRRLVGYWLGRDFWGRGVATAGLKLFVAEIAERPLHAFVVISNVGSQRVLEKAGFTQLARHMSPEDGVEEFVYRLD